MRLINIFKLRNLKKIILNPSLVLININYNFKRMLSDVAAFFGKYKYKYNIIFIAGMPMSATTLVKNMLGLVPGYYTRYAPMPADIDQDITNSAFKYCPKHAFTLFKTHLNPWEENINVIRENNVKKVIVTFRDMRDVALSRYHRLLKWPKKKTEQHYMDYSKMDKEEALNHSIHVVASEYIPWMKGWLKVSKQYDNFVHFCSFEMLIKDPKKELFKILKFYEINLSEKKVSEIIEKTQGKGNMAKNMYEAALLPWAISTNFRSGKIGGWNKEFTENNKNNFKKTAGDFLIEQGYEKNNSW